MTDDVFAAFRERITALDWMSEPTKQRALGKLSAVIKKVGYPQRWKDYSTYDVTRESFLGNVVRGNIWQSDFLNAKLHKPVDRLEWTMTPQTVARLRGANPQRFIGIKEATGVIDMASEIRSMCDIPIYSGDDSLTLSLMAVGAVGVISVLSNLIPGEIRKMVHLASEGSRAIDEVQHVLQLFGWHDISVGLRPDLLRQKADRINVVQLRKSNGKCCIHSFVIQN